MFLLLKELLQPDGLPAPTHPLGRGVFNETSTLHICHRIQNQKLATLASAWTKNKIKSIVIVLAKYF